jgi:hypothetical protein
MKSKLYAGVLLVFLLGLITMPNGHLTKDATAADPVKIEVYDPTGAVEVSQLHAPRLADLHGKTICELSDGTWEDNRTFPLIRELLQKQFPTARFIPYTEFPYGKGGGVYLIDDNKVADMVKKKGCQAVIVGNAG